MGCTICLVPAGRRFFPPPVAVHLVRLACELPEEAGRSLAVWDRRELARQLVEERVVKSISHETVRRILWPHRLKPWRHHMWLGSKGKRDPEFLTRVKQVVDLYTRPLEAHERVLCVDEKTHLQPRSRIHPTRPALPDRPVQQEHEYRRAGASNLFAAFDTRTGKVYGQCYRRKRSQEFIEFLEYLDRSIPAEITQIHVVLDNLRMHKSKAVQAWLLAHPRFRFHFTPVHCSWMNQVEQWLGTLQRKRFVIADFPSLEDMEEKILRYIEEYNRVAHPYNWSTKSAAKVMAWAEKKVACTAAA